MFDCRLGPFSAMKKVRVSLISQRVPRVFDVRLPYGLRVCGLRGAMSQRTTQSTAPMRIMEVPFLRTSEVKSGDPYLLGCHEISNTTIHLYTLMALNIHQW